MTRPPFVIALPQGLNVSGVTLWAVRLVNGLAARGYPCGLILHREPEGQQSLEIDLDPGVRVFDVTHLPSFDEAPGSLDAFIDTYRDALRAMGPGPIVFSPNLMGDCYGIGARLTRDMPDLRLVGWAHSDNAYDIRVLAHYASILSGVVGVSRAIVRQLIGEIPNKPIARIPYGVETHAHPPTRPFEKNPLRLVYTGRMEHRQKRVLALVAMADALSEMNIAHELTLVGDGPAAEEIDRAIATRPSVRRLEGVGPAEVRDLLGQNDVFVLASRYEGLSVSMLEALAAGCVPVVARVRSGASEAVEHDVNGLLVECDEDDEQSVGAALADAVARVARRHIPAMSWRAWSVAHERYSIERHLDAVEVVITDAFAGHARVWPEGIPCAFTAPDGAGSGTVPASGADHLRALLASLSGRRVVVHGAGRHTIELADVFRDSDVEIAAYTDDDRQRHGTTCLGVPVIAPSDAAETGATDVVISSWIHQDAIWERRTIYERQGLRVHHVYPIEEAVKAA